MIQRYTTVIAGFMVAIASMFAAILNESAAITLSVTLIVTVGLLCTVCTACQIICGIKHLRSQGITGMTLPQQVQDTGHSAETEGGANGEQKPISPNRSVLMTIGACSLVQS